MTRREHLCCLCLCLLVTTVSCEQVSYEQQFPQTSRPQRFEPKRVVEFESKVSRTKRSDWTVRELPFANGEDINLIEFPNPTTGWAATKNGGVYRTDNGGSQWERVDIKLPSDAIVVSISFVTQDFGWILLQVPFFMPGLSQSPQFWLLQTENGGRSWSELFTGKDAALTRAILVSRDQGWLVGRKWSQADSQKQSYFVLQTVDGGKHWIDHSPNLLVPIPGSEMALGGDSISDIKANSSADVTLLTSRGAVFRTSDSGNNWNLVEFMPKSDNVCICHVGLVNANEVWVGGGTSSIEGVWSFYSRLEDRSRYEYSISGVYFSDLAVLSDNKILAVGSIPTDKLPNAWDPKSNGVVFYSANGGRSWSIVFETSKSALIRSIETSDPKHLWAVGRNGLLLELKRSG